MTLCFNNYFSNLPWVSDNPKAVANSTLSGVDKYLIKWLILNKMYKRLKRYYLWASNLFSSPVNWGSLKTVLAFLLRQCLNALIPIPIPSISGTWHPLFGKPVKKPDGREGKVFLIAPKNFLINFFKIKFQRLTHKC